MKTVWTLMLLAALLSPLPAHAETYFFTCVNFWTQQVNVPVEATSLDDARSQLKNNQKLIDKYSLDSTARCSEAGILKNAKKKRHHHSEAN